MQFVPLHGEFEYDKVPFSNLIAGTKTGFTRDEVHSNLKEFFQRYSGAKNVARVLKAWLVRGVEDLPKQPWSLLLTHILLREARMHCNGTRDTAGVDLLRQVVKELASFPSCTVRSSVSMALRWSRNSHREVQSSIAEAFGRWSDLCRGLRTESVTSLEEWKGDRCLGESDAELANASMGY